MDNDEPNYRSRSDASRRLFGDDVRDDTVTAAERDEPAPRDDRLFAPPRETPEAPRERNPFARPPEDREARRPPPIEPRFDRPAAEPYRPAEARREVDPAPEQRPAPRPRSDSLFDSPRETARERFGSPGSGLFDREDKPRNSGYSRDPVEPAPRPPRDWDAPAASDPPLRGSVDRGFDYDRPAPPRDREPSAATPRIDRLGDTPPAFDERPSSLDRAPPAPADPPRDRYADRPSFADREPNYEREFGNSPPPIDRGYAAPPPPRDQREYYDPEPINQAPPYNDGAYHGYHARELASVDEFDREYQYTDESAEFRRPEPSGYDNYGEYDEQYGEFQETPKRRGPFLLLGSLIGVAAIAGELILVYKQGVREGQNDTVPVVSAPQDPTKVEPSDPGGIEVSGRTKLIYDRIIGETTVTDETIQSREEPLLDPSGQSGSDASDPAAQQAEGGEPLPLPLPPPPSSGQQGSLDPAAAPGAGEAVTQAESQVPAVPATDPTIPSTVIQPGDATTAANQQAALAEPAAEAAPDPNDPIAQILASPPVPAEKPVPPSRQASPGTAVPTNPVEATPLPGSVPREDTQTASTDTGAAAPINLQPGQPAPLQPAAPAQPATQGQGGNASFADEPGSGIQFGTEPATPPASGSQDAQVAAVQPEAVVPTQPITGGRYVVQLASFRTEQEAQQEFERLRQRHGSLLDSYSSFIQQADLGSRGIYYRLRIGPIEQRATASQLCNSLISAGERDCFVGER